MDGTRKLMLGFAVASAGLLLASYVAAVDTGTRAPGISGRAMNGDRVNLASTRGNVVVVDFWASWCEPCAEAMPALERIYQTYRSRGLVVIGVSQDTTRANAMQFLNRNRVSFPVMLDADHSIANRYRPPTMPSTFVIDRNGVVQHVHAGFRGAGDARTLETQVRQALANR